MKKQEIKDFNTKPFAIFDAQWALLTSGDINHHNSMTISWGEMGTLWNKNVVTVYVKPVRYTYEFMESNEYFVLSFFDEKYHKALSLMGSKSGREINKDQASGLTPIAYKNVTIYREASKTLLCKKIYFNDLILENIPEEAKKTHYQIEKPHRMYIGEVIEIIENE